MKRALKTIHGFFFPPPGTRLTIRALPYVTLGVLTLGALVSGAYAWEYTNSPQFCGTSCHTMPPEYTAYLVSPHARINCVECHIGRDFIATQITRKAGDVKHIISLAFKRYEFPITADELRPARETCERCHSPEKFSDDSLREIRHFGDDPENTPTSTFLVLKTGGGSRRVGLGRGIHWHIENKILYYATDEDEQSIPFIRVYNEDGTTEEFVDLSAGLDPAEVSDSDLKEMDCISCHNRITHLVYQPEASMDNELARKIIDPSIPEIRRKGVEVLSASYASSEKALEGIAGLETFYRTTYPDYYASHAETIQAAIASIQEIYTGSVFPEQKSDWNSHPNNIGHKDSPGCFRCHDGKHLNAEQEAIRLECNLCHSIPVVAGTQDFVTDIEVGRGPEPESHLNANWIALHRASLNESCSACHDTSNPGGTDNSSFCSNSACHGSTWTYAGLDAPGLAEILAAQLPASEPTPEASTGDALTYEGTIGALLEARCGACHGDTRMNGLRLTTFADAMQGGDGGPAIVPGDPQGSLVLQKQSGAQPHFGQLSAEELEAVTKWIEAGAPEK